MNRTISPRQPFHVALAALARRGLTFTSRRAILPLGYLSIW
jgi:hypothetical protein